MDKISTINFMENKNKNQKLNLLIEDKILLSKLKNLDINTTENLLSYSLSEYKKIFSLDDYFKILNLRFLYTFIDDLNNQQKKELLNDDEIKVLNSSIDLLTLPPKIKSKLNSYKAYTIRDIKMLIMYGYFTDKEIKIINENGFNFKNEKKENPLKFIKNVTSNKDIYSIKLKDLKFKYYHILEQYNINTVGDLNNIDIEKLYYLRGIGKNTLLSIVKLLKTLDVNKITYTENNQSIKILNLSNSIENKLLRYNIRTINDLTNFLKTNILENDELREIENKLRKNNISYLNVPLAIINNYNINTYEDVIINKVKTNLAEINQRKIELKKELEKLKQEESDLDIKQCELVSELTKLHNYRFKKYMK